MKIAKLIPKTEIFDNWKVSVSRAGAKCPPDTLLDLLQCMINTHQLYHGTQHGTHPYDAQQSIFSVARLEKAILYSFLFLICRLQCTHQRQKWIIRIIQHTGMKLRNG